MLFLLELLPSSCTATISNRALLSCTGNTPLSLATAGGHDEVVKLLEPHTQAEATPAAPDDSFFPAEKFDQVRPGYLFKMGDQVRHSLLCLSPHFWRALTRSRLLCLSP